MYGLLANNVEIFWRDAKLFGVGTDLVMNSLVIEKNVHEAVEVLFCDAIVGSCLCVSAWTV